MKIDNNKRYKMFSQKSVSSLILMVIISGCATPEIKYTPPPNVELAEISIKLNLKNTTADPSYSFQTLDTCPPTPNYNSLGSLDRNSINTSAKIPAGRPVIFSTFAFQVAVTATPGFQCWNQVIFIPKSNAKYEIKSAVGLFSNGDQTQKIRCDAEIYQVNEQDGSVVLDQTQLNITQDENWCSSWETHINRQK